MKDFKEYRDKRIEEWKEQKEERLALRNCKFQNDFSQGKILVCI